MWMLIWMIPLEVNGRILNSNMFQNGKILSIKELVLTQLKKNIIWFRLLLDIILKIHCCIQFNFHNVFILLITLKYYQQLQKFMKIWKVMNMNFCNKNGKNFLIKWKMCNYLKLINLKWNHQKDMYGELFLRKKDCLDIELWSNKVHLDSTFKFLKVLVTLKNYFLQLTRNPSMIN